MTKSSVLNFFGVARAFALALALVGLGFVLVGLLASFIVRSPFALATPVFTLPTAYGLSALFFGGMLVLTCSLTRFFVVRMKFVLADSDH